MSTGPILDVGPNAPYDFGTINIGGTLTLPIGITNTGDSSMTINSIALTGGAPYSLTGLPSFPVTIGIGGNTSFNIVFSPVGAGTFNDTVTITCAASTTNSPYVGNITGKAAVGPLISFTPTSPLSFPNTVITLTSAGIVVTLKNSGSADLTVSAIALASGVNFALSGLPGLPLLMHVNDTTTFTCKFTPLSIATLTDTINVTTDTNDPAIVVQGDGVNITPIAILSVNYRQPVLAFLSSPTPTTTLVALFTIDSSNLNGGLDALLIFNGTLWDEPGIEKKLRRVEVYYENYGVFTLTATVSVLRPILGANSFDSKTQSLTAGTSAADLSERSMFFDIQIAGEIILLELSRTANSGPISLIGVLPYFEEGGGEKVAGR